jgi:hypothetical protein
MGRHMTRLLRFAINYPGWHTLSPGDQAANRAATRLAELGLIEIVEHVSPRNRQFRLTQPKEKAK